MILLGALLGFVLFAAVGGLIAPILMALFDIDTKILLWFIFILMIVGLGYGALYFRVC